MQQTSAFGDRENVAAGSQERLIRENIRAQKQKVYERARKNEIDFLNCYVQQVLLDGILEEALKESRRKLQDSQQCVACLDEIAVWEFSCKHLVYCKSCMRVAKKKAAKEKGKEVCCPLCRCSGRARRR